MSKKVTKRPPKQIKPNKGMRILLLVEGILFIICGLPLIIASPVFGILAVAYGIFCIRWSKKYKAPPKEEEPVKKAVQTTVTPPAAPPVNEKPISVVNDTPEVSAVLPVEQAEKKEPLSTPVQKSVSRPSTPPQKTERHRVAGTSYRTDAIKSLGTENPIYELTKRDLIDLDATDESIYEYEFPIFDAELIEEPDNEVDPNAIKVVLNGVHVGYIKAGSCNRVKKRMREDRIKRVTATISGGRYKYVSTYYDDDGEERYTFDKGERFFSITLTLYLKD